MLDVVILLVYPTFYDRISGNTIAVIKTMLLSYNSDRDVEYIGYHTSDNANTSDSSWYIKKWTYDSNGDPVTREKRIGAWNNRQNLNWSS